MKNPGSRSHQKSGRKKKNRDLMGVTSGKIALLSFITGFIFIMCSLEVGLSAVKYQSPIEAWKNDSKEYGLAVSTHTVLIVVDGLRYDTSTKVEYFNTLRNNGAHFISWTGVPSLSYPGWSAIISGAKPEVSGKLLNWNSSKLTIETIFSTANDLGISTAVVGTPEWWYLIGDDIQGGVPIEPSGDCIVSDMEIRNASLKLVENLPGLTLIHFLSVDAAGHEYGGKSTAYEMRANEIGRYIQDIAEKLDWNTTTLIVTSDHGHLDSGGHGGDEIDARKSFVIFYGNGIKKAYGEINQIDICPTIANILGIKIPSCAQGRIIFECINQSEENKAIYSYLLLKQRYLFGNEYLSALGMDMKLDESYIQNAYNALLTGSVNETIEISQTGLEIYDKNIADARNSRIYGERLNIAFYWLLSLVVSVFFVVLLLRTANVRYKKIIRSAALTIILIAFYYCAFFLLGLRFSFSVFNEVQDVLKAIFITYFVPGILTIVAGGVYIMWLARVDKTKDYAGTACVCYGTILISFIVVIGWYAICYGFLFKDFVTNINCFMVAFLSSLMASGALMYLGITIFLIKSYVEYKEKHHSEQWAMLAL